LQIVTALVIIVLGVALYNVTAHINKTAAGIALCFYVFEALFCAGGQICVFSLAEISRLYSSSGDTALSNIGSILLTCKEIAGGISIIAFGLGAILFYYLLMKTKVIPKWLAIWGLVTVPVVLVGYPLIVFGVPVPFALLVPYVPWEFIAGVYIFIRASSELPLAGNPS